MRRWLAPAGIAVVVLALIVGVTVAKNGSGGSKPLKTLPALALASGGSPEAARLAAGATAQDANTSYGYRTEYRLTGQLPTSPTEAPAYELGRGSADADDVRRLATALGISANPTRTAEGWQATDGERTVFVSDSPGQPWNYSPIRCEDTPQSVPPSEPKPDQPPPDQPVAEERPTSSTVSPADCASSGSVSSGVVYACPEPAPCADGAECAAPSKCPEPSPPAEPARPSQSDAKAVADRILNAVGLGNATVSMQPGWGTWETDAAPVVGDLPTLGWSTHVGVDADKKVTYASGYLAAAEATAAYPLRTATEAFDDLKNQPQMDIMIACAPESSCTPPQPRTVDVTGARLGLVFGPPLDATGDAAYLVPAWLYATTDGELAVIALPERYFAKPSPPPDPQTDPGQTEPEPPPPAEKPVPADGGGTAGSEGSAPADQG